MKTDLDVKVKLDGWRCLRCQDTWRSNLKNNKRPKKCPKCGTYLWDKPVVGRWPKKPEVALGK